MNGVDNISFSKIIKSLHFFKYLESGFAINDYHKSVDISNIKLFKYPFRFDGIIIVFASSGLSGEVIINFNKTTIKENQLFISKPGDIIVSDAYGLSTPKAILLTTQFMQNLQFRIDDVIPAYINVKNNPVLQLTSSEILELEKYYYLILDNINLEASFSKEIVEKLVSVYLYKIANILRRHSNDFSKDEPKRLKRDAIIFNEFIKLISTNKYKERKVDFYAKELHLSSKYFSSLIKSTTGSKASDWINNYVIQEAKSLIKYSNMSIQEIAYHLNFPNQSFFGKYFKHQTGMSPKKYKDS